MSEPLTSPNLASPSITHGFFTRRGGNSSGIFSGLNTGYGSGEDQEVVRSNRHIVAAHFGRDESSLLTLYQVHSALCVPVTGPFEGTPPEADAMATTTPGVILGILTADCGPLLFKDEKAGVIAAAHAGWKGAHGGVIENTILAMEMLGAKRSDIACAVGPCIGWKSYEVGPEFIERITVGDAGAGEFFTPPHEGGKSFFDLRNYIKRSLQNSDIKNINILDNDTLAEEENFFSYRRATLRGEEGYGRQISCIMLNPD